MLVKYQDVKISRERAKARPPLPSVAQEHPTVERTLSQTHPDKARQPMREHHTCSLYTPTQTYDLLGVPLSYDAFGVILSPLQLLKRSGAPGASIAAVEVRQYFRHHVAVCSRRVRVTNGTANGARANRKGHTERGRVVKRRARTPVSMRRVKAGARIRSLRKTSSMPWTLLLLWERRAKRNPAVLPRHLSTCDESVGTTLVRPTRRCGLALGLSEESVQWCECTLNAAGSEDDK